MAEKINLKSPRVKKNKSQVATYGTQTPLSSTAVERGTTRWLSGSTVVIQGLLDVTGTALVSGLLDVTGTFNGSGTNNLDGTNNLSGDNNLTGPTEISGSLDVTGPTTLDGVLTINGDTSITGLLTITGDTTITGTLAVDGPTTISGTLDIEGATTVAADFEIISGGLFKSGGVEIRPDGSAKFGLMTIDALGVIKTGQAEFRPNNGGELAFNGGSLMSGDLLGITLEGTSKPVTIKGPTVDLSSSNVRLPNAPNTDVGVPNVHIDSSGRLYRVTNP